MPTDNPKISLYVPQQIYDHFKEFQEEQKLSMSQAGIVILAEYFGLKENIKEITEGTTIGGVTLSEFSWLKEKVLEIEELVKTQDLNQSQVSEISVTERKNKPVEHLGSTSESLIEEKVVVDLKQDKDEEIQANNPQLELLSEPLAIKPLPAIVLSEKRLGLGKSTLAAYKRKHSLEELYKWIERKDPDGIAWVLSTDGKGYIPKSSLSSELKSKLLEWFKDY